MTCTIAPDRSSYWALAHVGRLAGEVRDPGIGSNGLAAAQPADQVTAMRRPRGPRGLLGRIELPLVSARLEVPPAHLGTGQADHADVADRAVGDESVRRGRRVAESMLGHHGQPNPGASARLDHRRALGLVLGHGFLDEDVFAGGGRGDGLVSMDGRR
jgi:hypothetical protein